MKNILKEVRSELQKLFGNDFRITHTRGMNNYVELATYSKKLFSIYIPIFWFDDRNYDEDITVLFNYSKNFIENPRPFFNPYDRDLLLAQLSDLGYRIEFEKYESLMLDGLKGSLSKKGVFSIFKTCTNPQDLHFRLRWKNSIFQDEPESRIWLSEDDNVQKEVLYILDRVKPEKVLYLAPERLGKLR